MNSNLSKSANIKLFRDICIVREKIVTALRYGNDYDLSQLLKSMDEFIEVTLDSETDLVIVL